MIEVGSLVLNPHRSGDFYRQLADDATRIFSSRAKKFSFDFRTKASKNQIDIDLWPTDEAGKFVRNYNLQVTVNYLVDPIGTSDGYDVFPHEVRLDFPNRTLRLREMRAAGQEVDVRGEVALFLDISEFVENRLAEVEGTYCLMYESGEDKEDRLRRAEQQVRIAFEKALGSVNHHYPRARKPRTVLKYKGAEYGVRFHNLGIVSLYGRNSGDEDYGFISEYVTKQALVDEVHTICPELHEAKVVFPRKGKHRKVVATPVP